MRDKAEELLAEAVGSDSQLIVAYVLSGMAVAVDGGTEWSSDGSTRDEVLMEEAIRSLQRDGFLEPKYFIREGLSK